MFSVGMLSGGQCKHCSRTVSRDFGCLGNCVPYIYIYIYVCVFLSVCAHTFRFLTQSIRNALQPGRTFLPCVGSLSGLSLLVQSFDSSQPGLSSPTGSWYNTHLVFSSLCFLSSLQAELLPRTGLIFLFIWHWSLLCSVGGALMAARVPFL